MKSSEEPLCTMIRIMIGLMAMLEELDGDKRWGIF
jgi:hypothetical protein